MPPTVGAAARRPGRAGGKAPHKSPQPARGGGAPRAFQARSNLVRRPGKDDESDSEEEEEEVVVAAALSDEEEGEGGEGNGGEEGGGGDDEDEEEEEEEGDEGEGDEDEEGPQHLAGISEAERASILAKDGPELVATLQDLKKQMAEVRAQLLPLKQRVAGGGLPTAGGVSYLECKLQLLLSYCTSLAYYLLLKAEGVAVRGHAVVTQLVELRTLMEKLRPLDAKLKYQLDKLFRAGLEAEASAGPASADALSFKPNPEGLQVLEGMPKEEADDDDEREAAATADVDPDGVYRAPKKNAVHFEDKEAARERRQLEKKARRANRSEIVQALREEFLDTPVEMASIGSTAQVRDKEEDHRTRFEEDNFMRVVVGKKEKRRVREVLQGGRFEEFDDFKDIDLSGGRAGGEEEDGGLLKKRSLGEFLGGKKRGGAGGGGFQKKGRGGGRGRGRG